MNKKKVNKKIVKFETISHNINKILVNRCIDKEFFLRKVSINK